MLQARLIRMIFYLSRSYNMKTNKTEQSHALVPVERAKID